MKRLILAFIGLFVFVTTSFASNLSDEERAWLKAQKEITIGAMDNWAPLNFLGYDGKASGIGADIVKELNKSLDGKLKIVSSNWNTIYEKAKEGELHAIMDITPKSEREAFFHFTKPYMQIPHVIVSRKNQSAFGSLRALSGKKIALEKNIGTIDYLQKNFPDIKIKTYDDTSMALHALLEGEADAYVGNRAVVSYKIEQEFLNTLKIDALEHTRRGVPLAIGVSKKHPHLASILEKTWDAMPRETLVSIFSKWSMEKPAMLDLTLEEKQYLRTKKVLHFVRGSEEWEPLSFRDKKGQWEGLEVDFLKLLESRLGGVTIKVSDLPWAEAVKQARAHAYDGIISASPTAERQKDLYFSNTYYLSPLALVTKQEHPYMGQSNEFRGKRIALIEGSAFDAYVKEMFPHVEVVYSKEGTKGVLEMILGGHADAALDNLAPLNHLMEKEMPKAPLKISLVLYSETLSGFQYGLRNDEPLLHSIINKAIASYEPLEKKEIKERWEGKHAEQTKAPQPIKTTLLNLSPEEKAWVKAHPTIRVGNKPDWPPFDFIQDDKAMGLGIDYVTLIAQKAGLHVSFVQGPWQELWERFKARNIDVLHSIYKTPERETYALYTEPFQSTAIAMAVRKGSGLEDVQDLKGKRLALLKGYGTSEVLLKKFPESIPVMVANLHEGLSAVSFGEADAVIDAIGSMSYGVMQQTLTNVSIKRIELDEQESNGYMHIATTKDKPLLHSILQKGVASLTPEEHASIRSRWVLQMEHSPAPVKQSSHTLTLSDEEKQWLKEHPVLRFTGDRHYLPFEAFDSEGRYIGMVADYLSLIQERLGIHFEKIPSQNWTDALRKARVNAVDVISTYTQDNALKASHISTTGYIKSPIVIVTRKDKRSHFITDLSELGDDVIAVVRDYAYVDQVKQQFPKLNYLEVANVHDGMASVASGEVDAFLCSLTLATYSIGNMGLYNVHVAGKTDFSMELGLSVKKEFAPLVPILNKALASITQEETQEIIKHWGPTDVEPPFDFMLILQIVGAALLALAALFYWNYLLKRQVARKTAELSALLKAFDTHVIASKTDLRGNITYVSDAFCKISGSSREELLGKNHRISRHPDNDPKVYEEMWKTITHGGVFQGRIKNRKKDGGYYWVDSVVQQDVDVEGKVIGYTSIRHDVTAQVELQELSSKLESIIIDRTQELALLNEEQQAIFDSASVGIVLLKDRMIMQCNRRLDEMFGYEIGEQFWESADIWYPNPYDMSALYETIWCGETATWEQELKRKNGELFWARLSARAINPEAKVKGVVAVIEDITREKEAIEAIHKAKVLAEEATKVKSDFLANMSHEIRTPMNAILGMSHLVLKTDLSAKQRNYIDKINSASKNLLGIINDILDFSKIEAGKMAFEHIDFYLEDVMEHLADLSVMKAQEKGLELLFDVGTDVPTALKGDPLRLGQVLINLVNNAIKFTPKGEVKVMIRVKEHHEGKARLHFEVSDTGIGMSEEHQVKLFQAFSQADISTTRQYGGSGLGLAICKHLVEVLHGSITLESALGKGSVFSFDALFELQKEQKHVVLNDEDVQNLRILIVDDNESAREILEDILRSLKFEVTSVNSGYKAIEVLSSAEEANRPYGLVLMDWMMPELNGVQTIQKIREHATLSHTIAFIMITAYSKEELKSELESVHVDGVLIKPVSPSTLLNTILNVLGKEVVTYSRKEDKKMLYHEAVVALRGARILLVEDNLVNQEMAIEILEEAGLHVEVANNGFEALSKVTQELFDGVLMDCQMPIMDGFEATQSIRHYPQFASLPILAMTANAMMGDKEKCLECGMNDHIAKPIDISQLFLTMAKWIQPSHPQTAPVKEISKGVDFKEDVFVEGLDMQGALERVGGNQTLLAKLLKRFAQTQAQSLERIKVCLEANDAKSAIREAHTLKGLAGNIGAQSLFEMAQTLEERLKHEAVEHLDTLLYDLEDALKTVILHIDEALLPESRPQSVLLGDVQLREKLNLLEALLNDLDSEATDILEEIGPSLDALGYAKEVKTMQEHIANFDFELSSDILKAIVTQRGQ